MISIHKALAGLDLELSEDVFKAEISIHKALAGLDTVQAAAVGERTISIHKALAGLDVIDILLTGIPFPISIHKALAGLDEDTVQEINRQVEFQSTRPSRASTCR